MEKGLQMLADVKSKYGLRLLTDIHEVYQADPAGEIVDVLQIPALLCRQTDLLLAAAKTGKVVNIKKAQFLSGEDMKYPFEKARLVAREMADALALELRAHTPVPYFGCRVFTDAVCALACWMLGGLVGLGTLICAFCLGTVNQYFIGHFSE